MAYKIVCDSSANIFSLEGADFASVPLHILVGNEIYTDNDACDIGAMQASLDAYKGKTSTTCPNPHDWLHAFGDAEAVFCVPISSALSGSYASAETARELYLAEHPDRTVYVLDTLNAGPGCTLLAEKLRDLILEGLTHTEIYQRAVAYIRRTKLVISLSSVNNLAKNGRANPLLAKGIGLLDIKLIGGASPEGTLEVVGKARGDKKSVVALIKQLKRLGYAGGKIIVAHYAHEPIARAFAHAVKEEFGAFNGYIHRQTALCSYYAEPHSLMIGVEI